MKTQALLKQSLKFNPYRDKRSDEYKAGVMTSLQHGCHGVRAKCPYVM